MSSILAQNITIDSYVIILRMSRCEDCEDCKRKREFILGPTTPNYGELYCEAVELLKPLSERFPYHCLQTHILPAVNDAMMIGLYEDLDDHSLLLLQVAALLHDIGYLKDPKNHEFVGAEMAGELLRKYGSPEEDIVKIQELIRVTKGDFVNGGLVTYPKNKLEEVMCDADLASLGKDHSVYLESIEALREELKIEDKLKWYGIQRRFLEACRYHTKGAQKIFGPGKINNERNLGCLEGLLRKIS